MNPFFIHQIAEDDVQFNFSYKSNIKKFMYIESSPSCACFINHHSYILHIENFYPSTRKLFQSYGVIYFWYTTVYLNVRHRKYSACMDKLFIYFLIHNYSTEHTKSIHSSKICKVWCLDLDNCSEQHKRLPNIPKNN